MNMNVKNTLMNVDMHNSRYDTQSTYKAKFLISQYSLKNYKGAG